MDTYLIHVGFRYYCKTLGHELVKTNVTHPEPPQDPPEAEDEPVVVRGLREPPPDHTDPLPVDRLEKNTKTDCELEFCSTEVDRQCGRVGCRHVGKIWPFLNKFTVRVVKVFVFLIPY